MDIYVLDTSFKVVDTIDIYNSVIWTTRYYTAGDFELFMSVDKDKFKYIKKGYYLVREQDRISDDKFINVMIISNFEIKTDVENGDTLTITGKCLKSIVNRRVVVNQTILNGKVENCIKQLLNDNIINPTDTARKISNFEIGLHTLINTYTMSMQVTGDNLGEVITEICTTYGYGWDVFISDGKFIFYLYEGIDRSTNQNVNPRVTFSSEYDNLITSDYLSNSDNYANVAIVAGEGEGINRKKATAGTVAGLDRVEVFIDSRNSSTNEGNISESEYINMLIEEGNEALSEMKVTTSFEGDVDNNGTYQLNVDYMLGDLVQVINDYNLSATTRIIEIIESESDTGNNIVATFSTMEGV